MAKVQKQPSFTYKAQDVWSAAAAAFRVNEGYVKDPLYDYNPESGVKLLLKDANKRLINAMLMINAGWNDADVATGEEARSYWQAGIMKMLADQKLSDFDKMAIGMSEKEEVNSFYDIAVIGSLIGAAKRGQAREEVEYAKRADPGNWIGKTDEKVHLDSLIVVSCVYSVNYGSYRNEGTQNGNYVSWWGKVKLEPGQVLNVNAKVKAQVTDAKTGAKVTQVNYLKAAK